MSTLLFKLHGNKYVNHSFFRPYLFVYDDHMRYYKRRKIILIDEISMPYMHIVSVNRHKGLLFSKLEIVLSGGLESVHIKGVWNRPAKRAKVVIDKKVHQAHHKHTGVEKAVHAMDELERSLHRLKELMHKGKISEKEYNKKKKHLLKNL